jgi:hypothetical protein
VVHEAFVVTEPVFETIRSQSRPPVPAIEAAVDEEIVGLGWLLCWVDHGVVIWAI